MADDDTEFGLLMPFVVVESKGGPYVDDAYVAGFEAGRIDGQLNVGPRRLTTLAHVGNLPQLDLLAMNQGYAMTSVEPEGDGWATVTFEPAEPAVCLKEDPSGAFCTRPADHEGLCE